MASVLRLARSNDRTLFGVFQKLAEQLGATQFFVDHLGGYRWKRDGEDEPEKYKSTSHLIQKIEVVVESGARIVFARGLYDAEQVPTNEAREVNHQRFTRYRSPSSAFDEVLLTDDLPYLEDAKNLDSALSSLQIQRSSAKEQGEETFAALVTGQIQQLRELALDFSQRQLEAEDRLEKAYRKREDALQKRINTEEDRLATKAKDEEARIADERSKIEQWRNEINDREPQHERRRLRELLTAAITEKLDPSASSSRATERKTSYWYLGAGAVLLVYSAVLTIGAPEGSFSAEFWFRSVKALLAGLAGGGFLWAGLSHLKSAAVSARKFEESALRYRFDMDRASWVVETILQMNSYEAKEIPGEWLEAVCHDLFVNEGAVSEKQASLDAFSALFDATAKARLGTNGFEFEVDRKGAKRLAQS